MRAASHAASPSSSAAQPGWGHGVMPGSGGAPGSPSAEGDERAGKREHKRKAPARYDMDPSPPKAKRPKSRH